MKFWGSISGQVELVIHLLGLVAYVYELHSHFVHGLVAVSCPSVGGLCPHADLAAML